MQEAVSQLAEKGLTGFTARNGARWNPEGYTKMVIRTNTQNTINRIQDERIQACGGDFIEISSHSGARPLCSQDQGQVFSLSGYSGYIEDLDGERIKVRPWSSSTYGKPAGIFGINCEHSRYMFVPGLSKKREMDFTKKENDEAYIEKQHQRQYERTIRNKKREIAMLKQTGAEPSYIKRKQNSLSNTRKEYLDFLDKTGRTRITTNEWIGSTTLSPKAKEKSTKSYQNWKRKDDKKKQDTGLIGLKNGNVEIKDISQHLFERKIFRNVPYEDMSDAFTKPLDIGTIKIDEKGRKSIKYTGKKATIIVNPDNGTITTVWKTGKDKVKKYGDE